MLTIERGRGGRVPGMQEFSSVSVSSYEAGSLADQLTEQSRSGWSVIAIVPTGSTVTAYLSRDTDGSSEPAEADHAATGSTSDAPAEPAPASDTEPGFAAFVPDAVADSSGSEPFVPTEDVSTGEVTAGAATEASATDASTASGAAGAAPAGWYADPSGRFELRYWDGGQWTEHVSRAGQQYTDPPVA